MRKDTVFRGCTRPPMFMGVPYVPFFIGAGGSFLLATYINYGLLALLPLVIFVLRQMAKRDEMVFSLLGLRLQFRTRARNIALHEQAWTFTPNNYRRG